VNPFEKAARSVDRFQQRTPALGFGFAVAKKFGDDRGGSLAALLTYYGFLSLFPLLLILTTVLGFIGNRAVSRSVIGSTLDQFPVFGDQIGKDAAHPITGSGVALAIGLVVLLYGSLGVAQAAQHAMAEVWNIRGTERPGFFPRLGRACVFLLCLGAGVAATAALSSVTTAGGSDEPRRILAGVAGLALNVGLMFAVFRLLTPRTIPTGSLVPGSLAGGVGYSALLWMGTALVQHQLRHAEALYGQFGLVLGMLGWLFLVSELILYSAELNVVLAERLWPRSIVQPPLTGADRRVLENIARQAQRRPEERVGVSFTESHDRAAEPVE
jgi:YihY family inner membrane protein